MQFGEFIFPHNPHKISLSYKTLLVKDHYPFVGERAVMLGKKLRRVTCKGVFFGESASIPQRQLSLLLAEENLKTSSLVFVPGMEPFLGYLEECSVDFVEDGRIVPYTLLFLEEGDSSL